MKIIFTVLIGLTLLGVVLAQNSFDKSASIVSSQTYRRSVFNGRSFLDPRTVLRVDNRTYFTIGVCDGAQAGDVLPAQISKKKVRLLVGKKVCSLDIGGVE